MRFLNKGNNIPYELIKNIKDGSKVFVEAKFPTEYCFIGKKVGNKIIYGLEENDYWVLAEDFRDLCRAFEFIELN